MKTVLKRCSAVLFASAYLVITAGYSFGEPVAPDAAIVSTVEAFHKALIAGEPDKVMALLAPDALIIEAFHCAALHLYDDFFPMLFGNIVAGRDEPGAFFLRARRGGAMVRAPGYRRGIRHFVKVEQSDPTSPPSSAT